MQRRRLLIGLGGVAGIGGLIGSGAFTSVEANRDVTVEVANEDNAYLAMEPSSGPNGQFATQTGSGEQIALDFSSSGNGGSGVGLDSTYEFDNVFKISNQGTQTVYVWANFSGGDLSDDDIWFYPNSNSDKELNDGSNEVVTLPVGESVNIGVHINTDVLDSSDVGGTQALTATLTADIDVPSGSNPSDPGGGDAAVVSKNPDQGEYSSIQNAIDSVDGTTVYVEPGVYEETVNANVEGLTLASTQGRDDTTIGDPDGQTLNGPVLQVNAPDVTVDGFEIAGASGGGENGQGVDVNGDANDTDNTVLKNLRVRGNDDRGVVVDYSDNVLIENVISEDNYDRDSQGGDPPEDGFSSPGDADGFTIWYTNNSTLKNVTARRNGDNGIYIKGNNNTVDGATVGDNGDEGLDLSSDGGGGGDPDGGATVKNLTTNGNSAQEVAIEGHANDITIENSDLTLGSNGSSPPEPAGISVTDMDGGSVTITGTSFEFGADDDPVLAYVSDSAGAVDLSATLNSNGNTFAPNAELDGDAIVPENLNIVRSGDSIQTAIDNASQGDTLAVQPGTYEERPKIKSTDDLTVRGTSEDDVVIDGSDDSQFSTTYGFEVETNGVTLEGFTLKGPLSGNYGFKIEGGEDIHIENVTAEGSANSEFDLNSINGGVLRNVTANGESENAASTAGTGIFLTNCTDVELDSVTTKNNDWGGIGISAWSANYNPTPNPTAKNIQLTGTNEVQDTPILYTEEQPPSTYHTGSNRGSTVDTDGDGDWDVSFPLDGSVSSQHDVTGATIDTGSSTGSLSHTLVYERDDPQIAELYYLTESDRDSAEANYESNSNYTILTTDDLTS